jgi:hypothetical protein
MLRRRFSGGVEEGIITKQMLIDKVDKTKEDLNNIIADLLDMFKTEINSLKDEDTELRLRTLNGYLDIILNNINYICSASKNTCISQQKSHVGGKNKTDRKQPKKTTKPPLKKTMKPPLKRTTKTPSKKTTKIPPKRTTKILKQNK